MTNMTPAERATVEALLGPGPCGICSREMLELSSDPALVSAKEKLDKNRFDYSVLPHDAEDPVWLHIKTEFCLTIPELASLKAYGRLVACSNTEKAEHQASRSIGHRLSNKVCKHA